MRVHQEHVLQQDGHLKICAWTQKQGDPFIEHTVTRTGSVELDVQRHFVVVDPNVLTTSVSVRHQLSRIVFIIEHPQIECQNLVMQLSSS
ncbi:hypothetical protein E2542_SST01761 [Spatholobus suberectus]|nr:hypothetical protein E2542_SST01761 [Spatholobus suberectus]